MGKAYEYIRQTYIDQNNAAQLTRLVDAGVNEAFLFEDKISNTSSECGNKHISQMVQKGKHFNAKCHSGKVLIDCRLWPLTTD